MARRFKVVIERDESGAYIATAPLCRAWWSKVRPRTKLSRIWGG